MKRGFKRHAGAPEQQHPIGCTWWVGLLLTSHLLGSVASAQAPSNAPAAPRQQPIGLYLDCQGMTCDHDFLRTDIAFVTHLRDRHDADVHVLLTSQRTAEGGTEVSVSFVGKKEFAGVDDTLRYVSRPGDSADHVRHGLSNAIKRGLVSYVNRTSLGNDITVAYAPSASSAHPSRRDAWNHWTFATSVHGFVTGEELVKSTSFGLSLSANRTTDAWKITTSIHSQYNSATYHIDPRQTIRSIQRSHGFTTLIVGAVNDHVSVGGRTTAFHSPFLNQALTVRLAPAFELNVFPYRESNSRMLTLEYSVGGIASEYQETTVFGKRSERLLDQRLLASLRLTQPWGSALLAAEGANYLDDWRKHRVTAVGSVDWNLAKGLSLVTSVDVKRISDQLFLSARDASTEEILLRQRQLTTSYTYSGSIGISYTFGSPLAQIVNRRFGGTLGTMTVVQ